MRQAAWEELFKAAEAQAEEKGPPWWRRFAFISWEDIVTFVLVTFAMLTVVASVSGARWVPEMPPLLSIAFLGLGLGFLFAKLGLHEVVAHVLAVLIGTVGVIHTSTRPLAGSLSERVTELYERMALWYEALTTGGISNDNLPFVVMVVTLTFFACYVSAWSIFRWHNAWIGLIPGGLALLTNISYQSDQRGIALLIYLFFAILLVARVHVLKREQEWRRGRTGYPELLSLYVLNVTVWASMVLLAAAWVLPVGGSGGLLVSAWEKVTSPVAGPFADLSRVFSSIDTRRPGGVHQFGSTMPLQGEITLGSGEVMRVVTTEPGFLRAQTYDEYTPQGWKLSSSAQITSGVWPALRPMLNPDEARRQFRRPISLQVTTSKRQGIVVSMGQPTQVSIDTRVVFGPDPTDITSVRPTSRLSDGSEYRVESTLSSASPGRLRSAGMVYPAWIQSYLQLPDNYSPRVTAKAREVAGTATNPYDIATNIESFLRTYGIDTKIPPAPHNRDSVEYFLFELYRGYFDYHASAMVVMLRSLGIPARVSVGYVLRPQDRLPDSNTYVIVEANAFAWPEVYFPGLGWVEFNPTPSEPRISRAGSDDQFFPDDDLSEFPLDEFGLDEFFPDIESPGEALDELAAEEGSNLIGTIILGVIAIFLGLTLVGGGVFHFSWQHGLGGLDYPTQVWEKTVRLARWARIPMFPQQTPAEYAEQLQDELADISDVHLISDSFVKARYGKKDLPPAEKERLDEIWKSVRNTLLARIFRWK
jgi:transglutaminase-like putative cysteine protease